MIHHTWEPLFHEPPVHQRFTPWGAAVALTVRRTRSYRSEPNDLSPRRGAPTGENVEIEGVRISTEHWIGGERVGSSETFDDVSPIDQQVIARVARGGQA